MRKTKSIILSLGMAMAFLLLLAGCGQTEKTAPVKEIVIPKVDGGSGINTNENVESKSSSDTVNLNVNSDNTNENSPSTGMANPASVNCEKSGGTLEIRTGADGGQVGYCKFSGGKECEEWAMMRGECPVGGVAPGSEIPVRE